VGIAALALVVIAGLAVVAAQPRDVAFVVPPGTASLVAGGVNADVLPAIISLRVGDLLVIRNDDDQPAQVGPFRIDPGQKLEHRYQTPGQYDLVCTLHPSGQLRIVVRSGWW